MCGAGGLSFFCAWERNESSQYSQWRTVIILVCQNQSLVPGWSRLNSCHNQDVAPPLTCSRLGLAPSPPWPRWIFYLVHARDSKYVTWPQDSSSLRRGRSRPQATQAILFITDFISLKMCLWWSIVNLLIIWLEKNVKETMKHLNEIGIWSWKGFWSWKCRLCFRRRNVWTSEG